jgi:hypothetical protein
VSTSSTQPRGAERPPMAGWIVFTSTVLIVVGALDAIEGLIAVIRDNYYALHGNQLIVFDTTTWGWIMLIWGALLVLVGLALWTGAGWARWTAIVLAAINLIGQLGWLGNTAYPLWALVIIALDVIIIYALTARWAGYQDVARASL